MENNYKDDLYLTCEFYGDEGVECYSKKIVKCRKPHNCSYCGKEIKIGERSMYESGFLDGQAVSTYTCLECLDDWIEESQQCCSCCANEYGEQCESCSTHRYDYFKYKE